MSGSDNIWVGTSTNYVLNSNMEYNSTEVNTLKQWLDTGNVLCTRKDKTIYVLAALDTYDANNVQNVTFGGNSVTGNTGGAQWYGFESGVNVPDAITADTNQDVYGDASANTDLSVGIAGTGKTAFSYNDNRPGNINASHYLWNSVNSDLVASGQLPSDIRSVPVDGSMSTDGNLLYADSQNVWNRLINANLSGNIIVTASVDPCDWENNAIPMLGQTGLGNAVTNEEYRHQFQVRANVFTANTNIDNPAYILRIDRFGKNYQDANVQITANNYQFSEFSANFYANIPYCDSKNYALNDDYLNSVTFNAAVVAPNVFTLDGGWVENSVAPLANTYILDDASFTSAFTVSRNSIQPLGTDYVHLPIAQGVGDTGKLSVNDKIYVVQAGLEAPYGSLLYNDIVNLTSPPVGASTGDKVDGTTIFDDSYKSTLISERNPKILTLYGDGISSSDWVISEGDVVVTNPPEVDNTQIKNIAWAGGNIDLYLERGGLTIENYYVDDAEIDIEDNPYLTSVPFYIDNVDVSADDGKLVFDDNTITKSGDIETLIDTSIPVNCYNRWFNGSSTPIPSATLPEFHLYVSGNSVATDRCDLNLSSVVKNTASYVADAWNNVTSEVSVDYNTLTLSSDLAKVTPKYTLFFGNYVGKFENETSDGLGGYYANFAPNVYVDGDYTNSLNNVNPLTVQSVLNNNEHLANLQISGVLYTDYTFISNYEPVWTDTGNVSGLISGTNYKYNRLLPFSSNANTGDGNYDGYENPSDVNINALIAYTQPFDFSVTDDVYKLVNYEFQYKSYVSSVTLPNNVPFDNNTYLDSTVLNANVFVDNSLLSMYKGNLTAPSFLSFYYDTVNKLTKTRDLVYPFFSCLDTQGLTDNNIAYTGADALTSDSANYFFPGFTYTNTGSSGVSFFDYKDSVTCDFDITNPITGNMIGDTPITFYFHAINVDQKTVVVSKNNEIAKIVSLRPIRYSRRNGHADWYSYLVLYAGVKQYQVLLFRLDGDATTCSYTLPTELQTNLPARVVLSPVGSWTDKKITFRSALTCYDNAGDVKFTGGNKYTIDVSTYQQEVEPDPDSTLTQASVKMSVFSRPIPDSILTMSYLSSTIKLSLAYTWVDYNKDNVLVSGSNTTFYYASAFANTTGSAVSDYPQPNIPAYTNRLYLQSNKSVYVDISANPSSYVSIANKKLRVYRSITYTLNRSYSLINQVVGSGFMNRAVGTTADTLDTVTENLATENGGFKIKLTHNVIDISARLICQSAQTSPAYKNGVSNEKAFNLQTLADKLSLIVASYNAVLASYIGIESYNVVRSDQTMNLSTLLGGTLPSITYSSLRGYPYGNNYVNFSDAVFSLKFKLDTYNLYFQPSQTVINRLNNRCLYSVLKVPSTGLTPDIVFLNTTPSISPEYQENSFTPNNVLIARYDTTGFGEIKYYVDSFMGHYTIADNPLTDYTVNYNGITSEIDQDFVSTLSNTYYTTSIQYDGTYFIEVNLSPGGSPLNTVRLDFKDKTALDTFVDKYTSFAYTGRTAIVVHCVKAASNTTVEDLLSNMFYFPNALSLFDTVYVPNTPTFVASHTYSVLLSNSSGVNTPFYSRTLTMTHKEANPNSGKFFLAYNSFSGILYDTTMTYKDASNNTTVHNLYVEQIPTVLRNYNLDDKDIYDGKTLNNLSNTVSYQAKLNDSNGPNLFVFSYNSSISSAEFNISFLPAQVHLYAAYDQNHNNIIDYNISNGETLSEAVYNLTPPSTNATSFARVPSYVASYNLDSNRFNLPNTLADINFNKKFSVGYNYDTFFVLRPNNIVRFGVVEVYPYRKIDDNNIALKARRVQNLLVSNNKQWARNDPNDTGVDPSGLTFKINDDTVLASTRVYLFCSNSPTTKTLEWKVSNAGAPEVSRKIDNYDEERYAAMLGSQLSVEGKLSNE